MRSEGRARAEHENVADSRCAALVIVEIEAVPRAVQSQPGREAIRRAEFQRDQAIVDDAVSLLDGLAASVHDRSSEPLSPETGPIMTVGDVERMLDDTPRDGTRREGGATLLTDSYDFSELERREAGERPAAAMDQTAPIPLDLSDWGDATPLQPANLAEESAAGAADATGPAPSTPASPATPATDAQERRNAASS